MIFGQVLKYSGLVIAGACLVVGMVLLDKINPVERSFAFSAFFTAANGLIVAALGEAIRALHRIATAAERRANLDGARLVQEAND